MERKKILSPSGTMGRQHLFSSEHRIPFVVSPESLHVFLWKFGPPNNGHEKNDDVFFLPISVRKCLLFLTQESHTFCHEITYPG